MSQIYNVINKVLKSPLAALVKCILLIYPFLNTNFIHLALHLYLSLVKGYNPVQCTFWWHDLLSTDQSKDRRWKWSTILLRLLHWLILFLGKGHDKMSPERTLIGFALQHFKSDEDMKGLIILIDQFFLLRSNSNIYTGKIATGGSNLNIFTPNEP